MSVPRISIIIPNYNHASFLKQRIESILNQTYSDYELIILDDASNDGSVELINQYRNHPQMARVELNQMNSGKSILQWKKGIDLAKGEWIWFAESDDFCESVFLEKLVLFADLHPQCGVIYCQSDDVNSEGEKIRSRVEYTSEFKPNIWEKDFAMRGEEFIQRYLKVKNVIPNASAVLFKKSLVSAASVFESPIMSMRYAADWFFWILLLKKSEVGFIKENYNYFREHRATTRVHDTKEKIFNRLADEIKIRHYLENIYPEIDQENEWEIIYSKWFSVQGIFPYFNRNFYFPQKRNLSLLNYIQKYSQFKKRKRS